MVNSFNNMPQMTASFAGWQTAMRVTQVQQYTVDGLVKQRDNTISFKGHIKPLSVKKVELKPEGQRAWAWYQIKTPAHVILNTGDLITVDNDIFKVMGQNDTSRNGFMEYHAVKDYQNA